MPITQGAQASAPPYAKPESGTYLNADGGRVNLGGSLTSTHYNGKIILVRQVVPYSLTISAVSFIVNTLVAAKVARVGIYSDVGGLPGALLLDAGTASLATTGVKDVAASLTLSPGAYWLAFLTDATGTAVMESVVSEGYKVGVPSTTTGHLAAYRGTQAYGALPASLPALSPFSPGALMFLKAA